VQPTVKFSVPVVQLIAEFKTVIFLPRPTDRARPIGLAALVAGPSTVSGNPATLFASAAAGTPYCNATEITTLASSRMAASPLPSLAPDRNASSGLPSGENPIVPVIVRFRL